MNPFEFDQTLDIAWCPGCGNFTIRKALIEALGTLELDPKEVVLSSGIGQAAKMPQYVNTNYFNGLHGRGLPVAVAIKTANPDLTVIAEGGDGDMYGEGGNHFIHNIRRNPDITHIVHNNMIYGLTQGQASPTSPKNLKTPVQTYGVYNEPVNPIALSLAMGATFVARTFSGNIPHMTKMIKAAIAHKGYALIDVFHPCVTFNKVNTFKWYKEHTYYLEDQELSHDSSNFEEALKLAYKTEQFPLGIIYQDKQSLDFSSRLNVYKADKRPIIHRKRDISAVNALINS